MLLVSLFVWLRAGAGLLAGGLGMILFASLISHQGESVPTLFLVGGAVVSMIGGGITFELAQRYCRIERERIERETGAIRIDAERR